MEFSPFNPVVKLCIRGMDMEEKGQPEDAVKLFLAAWNEATDDFEKYLAAYYIARQRNALADKLKWYETALQYALQVNDDGVTGAFPRLHTNIAQCYEELGESDKAQKHYETAATFPSQPTDEGPFYHGTKADLQVGDMLTAGRRSNYQSEIMMNHIYFTALHGGAGLAAALAKGEGRERVYIVEPTGEFENDPNVTNKKFPGNPTRSYRTDAPLKIVGEVTDWQQQVPDELQKWRKRLDDNKGEIIN
ncbi:MAG: NAD(+)--rifampin ADP-ribosyltransferase [Chitinophagales bacterium]|nr:NAD(+)--rifampin ADP-ribosyltransferase [Chitinophagales bacterium]